MTFGGEASVVMDGDPGYFAALRGCLKRFLNAL